MQLEAPNLELFDSFQASMREWGEDHQDGAGIRDNDAVRTAEGFRDWVYALLEEEYPPVAPGLVTCTYLWMVEDGEYLGSIALRHELNEYLENFGGHIGYGVRPSARRRGLATSALRQILQVARARGLERVLLTCDDDNAASATTIERCGGVLEDVRTEPNGRQTRRYWIDTPA